MVNAKQNCPNKDNFESDSSSSADRFSSGFSGILVFFVPCFCSLDSSGFSEAVLCLPYAFTGRILPFSKAKILTGWKTRVLHQYDEWEMTAPKENISYHHPVRFLLVWNPGKRGFWGRTGSGQISDKLIPKTISLTDQNGNVLNMKYIQKLDFPGDLLKKFKVYYLHFMQFGIKWASNVPRIGFGTNTKRTSFCLPVEYRKNISWLHPDFRI